MIAQGRIRPQSGCDSCAIMCNVRSYEGFRQPGPRRDELLFFGEEGASGLFSVLLFCAAGPPSGLLVGRGRFRDF